MEALRQLWGGRWERVWIALPPSVKCGNLEKKMKRWLECKWEKRSEKVNTMANASAGWRVITWSEQRPASRFTHIWWVERQQSIFNLKLNVNDSTQLSAYFYPPPFLSVANESHSDIKGCSNTSQTSKQWPSRWCSLPNLSVSAFVLLLVSLLFDITACDSWRGEPTDANWQVGVCLFSLIYWEWVFF